MNAPVRGHRLSGPDQATFRRRLIAYREHKVHERRARRGELVPVLTAQALCRKLVLFEKLQSKWIHAAGQMGPCAEGFELVLAERIENRLCHNAARRVTGTQE